MDDGHAENPPSKGSNEMHHNASSDQQRSCGESQQPHCNNTNPKPFATLKGFKKFQANLERKKLENVPRRELPSTSSSTSSGGGEKYHPHPGRNFEPLPAGSSSSSVILGISTAVCSGSGGGSDNSGIVNNAPNVSSPDGAEEWVLHTSCLDDSSDLLHECCCQPESSISAPEEESSEPETHLSQHHQHSIMRHGLHSKNIPPGVHKTPTGSIISVDRQQNYNKTATQDVAPSAATRSSVMYNVNVVAQPLPPPPSSTPISVTNAICPPPPPRDADLSSSLFTNVWSHNPNEVANKADGFFYIGDHFS
jgi:hypothetical protein